MYQSSNCIVTNDLKLSCAKLAEVVYENHFQKLRGKEYYDLISLDFDKIINFSYSSSIEYLDSYISLLNSNISIIAENSDFISDFYKEKIFKLYSKFVKKQIGKYSEDNFNSLLKEDYDIKKIAGYYYNIITSSEKFNFNEFFKQASNLNVTRKIRKSFNKILISKKYHIKKFVIDESKLIRKKLNTLIYCIFPTEDIYIVDDAILFTQHYKKFKYAGKIQTN